MSVGKDTVNTTDHQVHDTSSSEDEDSITDESETITTSDDSESEVEINESSSNFSSSLNSDFGEKDRKEEFEQLSKFSDQDSAQG